MKIFRKIVFIFLIIILIVFGTCYINGKKLYDAKMSEISLDKKIESIKMDNSFVSLKDLP